MATAESPDVKTTAGVTSQSGSFKITQETVPSGLRIIPATVLKLFGLTK